MNFIKSVNILAVFCLCVVSFLWFGLRTSFCGSGISKFPPVECITALPLLLQSFSNLWGAKFVSTKNEIKIIWLHTCPVLDCPLLYDRPGRWNHMLIANVKVFLLFLIVDIISNCQTIIIDDYTKNRRNFFVWNEYNFDDIDILMLKRKADDEFKIIVLKQRNFSKIVRALHSCNNTVWALISVQWESHQHKTVKLKAPSYHAYSYMPRYYQTRPSLSTL